MEQRRLTTLNLSAGERVATASPLGLGAAAPVVRPPALDAPRSPVPQFNERGQTPLERILRDEDG
jgi:hypothetical protein